MTNIPIWLKDIYSWERLLWGEYWVNSKRFSKNRCRPINAFRSRCIQFRLFTFRFGATLAAFEVIFDFWVALYFWKLSAKHLIMYSERFEIAWYVSPASPNVSDFLCYFKCSECQSPEQYIITLIFSRAIQTFKVGQSDLFLPKSKVGTVISGYDPLQTLEGLFS